MSSVLTKILHCLLQSFPLRNLMSKSSSCIAVSTYRHPQTHNHCLRVPELRRIRNTFVFQYWIGIRKKPTIITYRWQRWECAAANWHFGEKKKKTASINRQFTVQQSVFMDIAIIWKQRHFFVACPFNFNWTTDIFVHSHHRCMFQHVHEELQIRCAAAVGIKDSYPTVCLKSVFEVLWRIRISLPEWKEL